MYPNPYIEPIYFDSCAFDGGNNSEQEASLEARRIITSDEIGVEILHSVWNEIEFPNTPAEVKAEEIKSRFSANIICSSSDLILQLPNF